MVFKPLATPYLCAVSGLTATVRSFHAPAWKYMQGRTASRLQHCANSGIGRWSVHSPVPTLERGNHRFGGQAPRSSGTPFTAHSAALDRSHAPAWECMQGRFVAASALCKQWDRTLERPQPGSHAGAWGPSVWGQAPRSSGTPFTAHSAALDRSHAPAWECMQGRSASRFTATQTGQPGR